jgi:hypothetical protein
MLYLAKAGWQWNLHPKSFPPHKTVFHVFSTRTRKGTMAGIKIDFEPTPGNRADGTVVPPLPSSTARLFDLLANSHDGKGSVQIKFTSVRVVCQNPLTLAFGGGESFRLIHTPDVKHRLKVAGQLLARIRARYDAMEEATQAMARMQVNVSRLTEYLTEVFKPSEPTDDAALIRAEKNRDWSQHFFEEGRGNCLPSVRETLWAAFNVVTELLDHPKTRQSPHQRLS